MGTTGYQPEIEDTGNSGDFLDNITCSVKFCHELGNFLHESYQEFAPWYLDIAEWVA